MACVTDMKQNVQGGQRAEPSVVEIGGIYLKNGLERQHYFVAVESSHQPAACTEFFSILIKHWQTSTE